MNLKKLSRSAAPTIDQAASSFTNFLGAALVANAGSAGAFGSFSVAMTAYLLTLGVLRATVCEPLLLLPDGFDQRTSERHALAGAAAVGVLAGAGAALAGGAVGGDIGDQLLVLAACLPFLTVLDATRYALFGRRTGGRALAIDLVWLVLLLTGWAALPALDGAAPGSAGERTALGVAAAYWISGAIAALIGLLVAAIPPALARWRAWFGAHRSVGLPLMGEFLVSAGAAQISLFILTGVSGRTAVGAVNAANIVFGPLRLVAMGAYVTFAPIGRRMKDRDKLRTALIRLTYAMIALSIVGVAGVMALGAIVGDAVFGDTWDEAQDVILPWGLYLIALATAGGAIFGLRFLRAFNFTFKIRIVFASTTLAFSLAGGIVAGARGFAIGTAAAAALAAFLYWRAMLQRLENWSGPDEATPPEGEDQLSGIGFSLDPEADLDAILIDDPGSGSATPEGPAPPSSR